MGERRRVLRKRASGFLSEAVARLQALGEAVEALADARGLERLVHEGLKDVDRLVMEGCVRKKAEQACEQEIEEVSCACCEGWATLLRRDAERYAVTVRGRVDYTRPVYRCVDRTCQKERAPFDEQLGLESKEHLTPLVQRKAVYAGVTACSFEKAEGQVEHQAELSVSAKEIHRLVEKLGDRALALQETEVHERGRPASVDRPLRVQERPETVVIEMDGTCVMGRDGEGHEVKCATVFGLDARAQTGSPGKERPILLHRMYCATSEKIRAFRAMVWAMAVWWGVRTARRVVIVGDGIDWIWNLSADRFHFGLPGGGVQRPVEILDFYHACENLAKARNAIYCNGESDRAKQWYDTWRAQLRQGRVEAVVEELTQRARRVRGKNERAELQRRAEYFRKHSDRMRYPEYEAEGLPIGSGAIEGTCKNLIKGRMDCVGQRWDIERGIERMVALRVRLFNERLDDLWPQNQRAA